MHLSNTYYGSLFGIKPFGPDGPENPGDGGRDPGDGGRDPI